MSLNFPPPKPSGENKRGNVHAFSRWRGFEHGYGEVTQRERRSRRAGGGGGERRMQMCGAVEKGGTMGGNTTSYCLEREDRSGPTREAAEDYSPEFTYTHTHKKAWLIESKHQSAVLHWSPDPDGQRSTGNDALAGELLMNWQYLPTRNNRGAKGKSVDTHHPSVGALTTEVSLPYSDIFVQVLSSAIVKNNEYATKHQDSAGLLRQV